MRYGVELLDWLEYLHELSWYRFDRDAILVGKGWSADKWIKENNELPRDRPIIAINEMTSFVRRSVGIAMDRDPVINVAKTSRYKILHVLPGFARIRPPMIIQDKYAEDEHVLQHLDRAGMYWVGVFRGGEMPQLRSTAAWAIHMLGSMGVRTIGMVGFDLFFHPDRTTSDSSPYSDLALKSIRAGCPFPDAAERLGRRSQDYSVVNQSMQAMIDAHNIEVVEMGAS